MTDWTDKQDGASGSDAEVESRLNGSHGGNGHAEPGALRVNGLHPSSMTARKLRAINTALREAEEAVADDDEVPDVGSGRIGTISEAAERLRAQGVLPPVQPMAQPGERRGPAVSAPRTRRKPMLQRRSFWITMLILLVVVGGPFAWWYFSPMIDSATGKVGKKGDQLNTIPRLFVDPQKALESSFSGQLEQHILLVGLDHVPPTRWDPNPVHRSDSVILMSTNLRNKEVRMLSIPRDGWVMHIGAEGQELGWDKLAHTYANGTEENRDDPEGGIRRTRMTVENLMGVSIDHYIIIEIDGFQKIIDELGGIDVDVEKRMKYRDRAGGLNIDLQPGMQRLTGEQAMGYARFRHDAIGDIGRMGRQQQVIKAIITKLQEPQNIPRLPALAGLLQQAVHTDLRMDQLLALTKQSGKFSVDKIQSQTLPSYWNHDPKFPIDLPGHDGNVDAQYINPEEVAKFRDFLLDPQPPPPPAPEGEAGTASDGSEGGSGEAPADVSPGASAGSEGRDPRATRNPCADG